MAVTENSYTGNGSTTNYSFTFPYLKSTDVQVQVDAAVTTAWSFANATTVQFNTAPASGAKIKILRDTNVDSLAATFYAGSSIKSEDLNDNYTQNLYKTQEVGARYFSNTGGTMTGDLTLAEDVELIFEGATDDAHETKLTVADPTADRVITLPNVTGTVVTTGDTGTVATSMIAADAVNGTKIADDSINSEHYVDSSIDTQHIADSQITTAKIADNQITTAKIVDASITTAKIAGDAVTQAKIQAGAVGNTKLASNAVTTVKIADNQITTAKIVNDAVTADKIANTSVTAGSYSAADITVDAQGRVTAASNGAIATSEITDSAVSTAKIANDAVTTAKIANNNVTTAKILDANVTTAKIADSNVTTAKIAANAVTSAKIADDAVGSTELGDGVIDTVHLGAAQVTTAKIADSNVTTAKITDANVTTAKIANDAITIGKLGCEQTTISDSDSHIPTSGAVVDYVAAQIAPLGGLEVIATEVAFPNTQPSSGVVISISDAGGIVVNGSGVSTTGRTVGGSTVTINGFPSSLQSKTMAADVGLMVSSTGSSQTYNYHKLLAKEADVEQLSNDINDFAARYRVGSSNPTSALDAGDLFFNTSTSKLLVYNATNSAWEEAQSIGNFFISTFSEAFDGSRTQFTLSNAPANVQQVLLSLNGVVQKPGTAFTLSGSTVTLASAPASGTDYFAVVMGSTVNIGTPSNNTVSTAILQDDSVTTAKIAASNVTATELGANAVITSKIADDAVTAAKIANIDGNINVNDNVKIRFGTHGDLDIYHDGSHSHLVSSTGNLRILADGSGELVLASKAGEEAIVCAQDGSVEIMYDNSKKLETTSAGVDITGQMGSDTIHIPDGSTGIQIGNSNDLRIYHDGSNSYIKDSGTGNLLIDQSTANVLYLRSDDLRLSSYTGTETYIDCNLNGAVELYHDNSKKFETASHGATLTGNLRLPDNTSGNASIQFGNSQDFFMNHNGSDSYIINNTGDLYIRDLNGDIHIQGKDNEESIIAKADGAVELYYDNSKKLNTHTAGIHVSGGVHFGASSGSDPVINNADGGNGTNMYFQTGGAYRLIIQDNGHTRPASNNTYDLGTSSDRWRNIYTNDLNLSNEGSSNDVDGTWGNWTIQEGESDLFLKNNRSGKKYKFNLTEVS